MPNCKCKCNCENDRYSKSDVLDDVKSLITDCRLIHNISSQIVELSERRQMTRSDNKREMLDETLNELAESRLHLIRRVKFIQKFYEEDDDTEDDA